MILAAGSGWLCFTKAVWKERFASLPFPVVISQRYPTSFLICCQTRDVGPENFQMLRCLLPISLFKRTVLNMLSV